MTEYRHPDISVNTRVRFSLSAPAPQAEHVGHVGNRDVHGLPLVLHRQEPQFFVAQDRQACGYKLEIRGQGITLRARAPQRELRRGAREKLGDLVGVGNVLSLR